MLSIIKNLSIYFLLIFLNLSSCSKKNNGHLQERPVEGPIENILRSLHLCTNGSISSSALSSAGLYYIGGSFTQIGTCSGSGVLLNSTNGSTTSSISSSTYPFVEGSISVSISDKNGGFYIGGQFSQVGSYLRNNIAHISAEGLVTSFNPNVDGDVLALALSSDRTTLYLGGDFSSVGGINRDNIAAVNTIDGSLILDLNLSVVKIGNPSVLSLALKSDDSILYLGGNFNTVGGITRNKIAAIDLNSNSVVADFNPNANDSVLTLALNSDDSILYFGGYFNTIGGATTRNRIAAFDLNSNSLVADFNPNANATVGTLALNSDDSILYFGGYFNTIGGATTRNRIAAFDLNSNSVVADFNPNANDGVHTLALNSDDSVLYFGGYFTTIGGATIRNYIAAFDLNSNSLVADFNPNANMPVYALALNSDDSVLYSGGSFTTIGGATTRNRIAAFDLNSNSLVADFNPNANMPVYALALTSDDSILYFGGSFTTIGGATTRNRIAAFDLNSNSLVADFNPNASGSVYTLALNSDDSILYFGGWFSTIGGATTRNSIAAFDLNSNSLVADFNPNASGSVDTLALNSDDSILYFGGGFGTIGGATTRNKIAAFDLNSNSLVADFNPNANDGVLALALNSDDSILYFGGYFNTIGGATTRNHIAAFDLNSNSLVADFDPNANNTVKSLALNSDDSVLYFGGNFTTVNEINRNLLAAVDANDGSVLDEFNPHDDLSLTTDSSVSTLTISPDDNTLYLGGIINLLQGAHRGNFSAVNAENGSLLIYP